MAWGGYYPAMNRPIRVHLLPALFEPHELKDGVAVVIDVLRATTTIVYALAAGAARVIPCGEVDEARRLAAGLAPGWVLLGGERGGLKIDGFDLGNSPSEYTAAVVAGKSLVFTTTNGTRALLRAREARRVFVAAFANLNAVVERLVDDEGTVHIVCAGTDGGVTLEDVLCAGSIAVGLCRSGRTFDSSDDSTQLAISLSENAAGHYDRHLSVLRASRGGRNLVEHGLDADIVTASRWDTAATVPELSREPWHIGLAGDSRATGRRFVEPPG
ncbi:MAG: 2-phosphosulfolactate phosphatase [Planctomycetaceae bacterium]|nr:2-phosphosulfolactate phosphatase [Planctomycetaceae bacterium]